MPCHVMPTNFHQFTFRSPFQLHRACSMPLPGSLFWCLRFSHFFSFSASFFFVLVVEKKKWLDFRKTDFGIFRQTATHSSLKIYAQKWFLHQNLRETGVNLFCSVRKRESERARTTLHFTLGFTSFFGDSTHIFPCHPLFALIHHKPHTFARRTMNKARRMRKKNKQPCNFHSMHTIFKIIIRLHTFHTRLQRARERTRPSRERERALLWSGQVWTERV